MSLGGLYLEGLIHGRAYFQNFTVPYHQSCPNCWKKKVDLVMALRTMLGEWGGIQALCCAGVNPA